MSTKNIISAPLGYRELRTGETIASSDVCFMPSAGRFVIRGTDKYAKDYVGEKYNPITASFSRSTLTHSPTFRQIDGLPNYRVLLPHEAIKPEHAIAVFHSGKFQTDPDGVFFRALGAVDAPASRYTFHVILEKLPVQNTQCPPTVPVPPGYRLLGSDEVIRAGDKYYAPDKRWVDSKAGSGKTPRFFEFPYIRAVIAPAGFKLLCSGDVTAHGDIAFYYGDRFWSGKILVGYTISNGAFARPINLEPGYRYLLPHEVVQSGDEVNYIGGLQNGKWDPAKESIGRRADTWSSGVFRRKVKSSTAGSSATEVAYSGAEQCAAASVGEKHGYIDPGAEPPAGFAIVRVGEKIQPGDICYSERSKRWEPRGGAGLELNKLWYVTARPIGATPGYRYLLPHEAIQLGDEMTSASNISFLEDGFLTGFIEVYWHHETYVDKSAGACSAMIFRRKVATVNNSWNPFPTSKKSNWVNCAFETIPSAFDSADLNFTAWVDILKATTFPTTKKSKRKPQPVIGTGYRRLAPGDIIPESAEAWSNGAWVATKHAGLPVVRGIFRVATAGHPVPAGYRELNPGEIIQAADVDFSLSPSVMSVGEKYATNNGHCFGRYRKIVQYRDVRAGEIVPDGAEYLDDHVWKKRTNSKPGEIEIYTGEGGNISSPVRFCTVSTWAKLRVASAVPAHRILAVGEIIPVNAEFKPGADWRVVSRWLIGGAVGSANTYRVPFDQAAQPPKPAPTLSTPDFDVGYGYRRLQLGEVTKSGDEFFFSVRQRWVPSLSGHVIDPSGNPFRRAIDVGTGYRLLQPGEVIESGDEVCNTSNPGYWIMSSPLAYGKPADVGGIFIARRKLPRYRFCVPGETLPSDVQRKGVDGLFYAEPQLAGAICLAADTYRTETKLAAGLRTAA